LKKKREKKGYRVGGDSSPLEYIEATEQGRKIGKERSGDKKVRRVSSIIVSEYGKRVERSRGLKKKKKG